MSINREQALVILYDLAFTIGSEVSREALIQKTLQRFLYHTGFPAGIFVTDELIAGDSVRVILDQVIGDYKLLERRKEALQLTKDLVSQESRLIEGDHILDGHERSRPYRVALAMPVPGYGHMILLGVDAPTTTLPLTTLFQPVLSRLGTAIKLCETYEREVQRRIERESHYDALTDLPNAQLFAATLNEALQRSKTSNRMLAVVQIDLDEFAKINHTYGNSAGDQVLTDFALRLRPAPWFYAARILGDEFALLITDVSDRDEAQDRLLQILEPKNLIIRLDDHTIELRASAGISLFPVDATDGDMLMRHARMALDDAKRDAHGTIRWFDSEQDRLARERRSTLGRVRSALENGDLSIYYQPQIDLRSNDIRGFEALLRWNREDGVILPGAFLPEIENNDLICDIGRYVLRGAVEQSALWRRLGLASHVSVNIAGRHLQHPEFIDDLKAVIESVPGAHVSDLEIEILETTAINDFERTRDIILRCRELGIRVALDDFGTGYSSLAYLSQLPVQTVKIDRLFVNRMINEERRKAVVQAIINIAGVFGHDVIAEGVETYEQRAALAEMGCHAIQGFYIATPMPEDQVPAWIPG